MKENAFIFINGIRTNAGASDAWTDRAVEWIHERHLGSADKFEYECYALTRFIRQKARVREFVARVSKYKSYNIHLMGHSNGCDIIVKALQDLNAYVESASLFSPACEADFEKNGLNDLINSGRLRKVVVYVAGSDSAMKIARATSWLQFFGKGYGTLGLSGPKNVRTSIDHRVIVRRKDSFEHSTWFDPAIFDETMRSVSGLQ